MVSALDSGCGRCVVFLCKSLYSHSAFLRSGVKMVTGELSRMPDEILDISITSIDGGGESLGSSTDFLLFLLLLYTCKSLAFC